MKNTFIRFIALGSLSLITFFTSFGQAVLLDSTFSGDGKVITDFGSYDDRGQSLKIQKDGKLILAGWAYNGSNHDIALARYETNGELDITFGINGKVITQLSNNTSRAYSLIIQPDSKIVVAAEGRLDPLGNTIVLVRYNQDGTLDSTFDGDGKVFTKVGNVSSYGVSLVNQKDNKLIVAGYSYHVSSYDFTLVRYNKNGSIDSSFGEDGIVVTSFRNENDEADALALQDDGKIVVVGSSFRDIALARYTSDGILDNTFSSDGKVITENDYVCDYSLAIQKDHKIIVVGEIDSDIGLFRYKEDGSLDITFGDNGKVTTDINGSFDRGDAVVIQDDGKIIVTGQTYGSPYADFALLRYNQDGSLDSTFDFDGKLTTDFSNYNDEGYSIVLQQDGKIVIAGETSDIFGYDFGIARYNTSELIHVNSEIKIYPNPTFGKIFFEGIDVKELIDERKINLFDVLGREIIGFEIDGNSIDITFLPSGAYFLKYAGQIAKIIKVSF